MEQVIPCEIHQQLEASGSTSGCISGDFELQTSGILVDILIYFILCPFKHA